MSNSDKSFIDGVAVTLIVGLVLLIVLATVSEIGASGMRARAASIATAMGHPDVAKAIQEMR